MTEVYLALGSNVGDSISFIELAIDLLKAGLKAIKQAPIYRSTAVGYTDQPDFLNTAISGQTDLQPTELLSLAHSIEQQLGRIERFHWGPREIDIDLIFYGEQIMKTDQLIIPHPEFAKRGFVLKPLSDLNPVLIDPLSGRTVAQLYDQLDAKSTALWPVD